MTPHSIRQRRGAHGRRGHELGHEIRARRIALGLTQAALAARAHLHPGCVGAFERGERTLAPEHQQRLADVLSLEW